MSCERRQRRVLRDAGGERVLADVLREVLLLGLREQEVDEPLRVVALLGALEHADPGDVDERADVAAREEVELDGVVLAVDLALADALEDVVVVDEPDLDLAVGDGVADDRVLLVGLDVVGLHVLEPLPGLLLALGLAHRGDERLERGVGGRPADLALPARLGQVEHRGGSSLALTARLS